MNLETVVRGWDKSLEWDLPDLPEELAERLEEVRAGKPARLALEFLDHKVEPLAFQAPEQLAPLLRPFPPIFEQAVREEDELLPPDEKITPALVSHINLGIVLDCVGCEVSPASWDLVRRWLPRLAVSRDDVRAEDYWDAAFAALALDEPTTYRRAAALDRQPPPVFRPGETFAFNLQGLLAHLALAVETRATLDAVLPAWEDLLHGYYPLREAHSVDAATLLWAGRTVFHRIGGRPLGEVARAVHDSAWALAGMTP